MTEPTPVLSTTFASPVRLLLKLADGTTKVVDVVGYEVHGAPVKRAPAAERLKPKATKHDLYTPTFATIGCADKADLWARAIAGDFDDVGNAEGIERAMCVLAIVRAEAFRHPRAQYTVPDCVAMGPAFKTHGIADLVRAIGAAAKDDWFKKRKTIQFAELPAKLPMLLAAAPQTQRNARDERIAIARDIAAALDRLRVLAPVEAAERTINVDSVSVEALRTHLNDIRDEIARRTT